MSVKKTLQQQALFKGSPGMKILVINCGSSSLKWNFYDTAFPGRIAGGLVECIGFENARHTVKIKNKDSGREKVIEKSLPDADHAAAIQDVLDFLTGENGPRARVCRGLDCLGIALDVMKNRFFDKPDSTGEISAPGSAVRVLVIPTDEEKMIAGETMRALQQNELKYKELK
jgi:acetate kinase